MTIFALPEPEPDLQFLEELEDIIPESLEEQEEILALLAELEEEN